MQHTLEVLLYIVCIWFCTGLTKSASRWVAYTYTCDSVEYFDIAIVMHDLDNLVIDYTPLSIEIIAIE